MISAPTVRYPETPILYPDDLNYDNLLIAPRLADLDIPTLDVLNLGAGDGSGNFAKQIQELPARSLVNVELFDGSLWRLSHLPHAARSIQYVHQDMLEHVRIMRSKSVDVCLCLDALEHLTRDEGLELLGHLACVVRQRTLIFLPFGDTPQEEYGGNPHQTHQSTWFPTDFPNATVDVNWCHFHVQGHPQAGWVTINY